MEVETPVTPCSAVVTRDFHDPAIVLPEAAEDRLPWYALRCWRMTSTSSIRTAARATMLAVAFFTAISQWSALGSGEAFFTDRMKFDKNAATAATSAAFSFCFLFCIVGGILGDAIVGSVRVLLLGLASALLCALCLAALSFPMDAFHTPIAHGFLAVFLFVFAAAMGLCQTATATLVGDQCNTEPAKTQVFYSLFYGALQLGAFLARAFFPLVDDKAGWFIGVACFVAVPLALTLAVYATNSIVLAYRTPLRFSPAAKALRILLSRIRGLDRDDLDSKYGPHIVRDTFRAASVLRLHIPLPAFWALYFQMFGLWYLQAQQLDRRVGGYDFDPSQTTLLNPLFDVAFLVVFTFLFRWLHSCCGIIVSPQVKIAVGYTLTVGAFLCATVLQYNIDQRATEPPTPTAGMQDWIGGNGALGNSTASPADIPSSQLSVLWQLPQFLLICAAEVLVYPSALHIAYINSPMSMRSFVQSALWGFIGLGNAINTIIILCVRSFQHGEGLSITQKADATRWLYILYTAFMVAALVIYCLLWCCYDEHPVDAEDRRSAMRSRGGSTRPPTEGINTNEGFLGNEQQPLMRSQPSDGQGSQHNSFAGVPGTSQPQARSLTIDRRLPVTPRDPSGNTVVYHSTRRSPRVSALDDTVAVPR